MLQVFCTVHFTFWCDVLCPFENEVFKDFLDKWIELSMSLRFCWNISFMGKTSLANFLVALIKYCFTYLLEIFLTLPFPGFFPGSEFWTKLTSVLFFLNLQLHFKYRTRNFPAVKMFLKTEFDKKKCMREF